MKSVVCEMRICSLRMKICSLRNKHFLSGCVYSDILNRKYENPWQKSEQTHREKTMKHSPRIFQTINFKTDDQVSVISKGLKFIPIHAWWTKIKSDANSCEISNVFVFSVVYFHYRLLLDFRTVFVEIKLPILLYYWITYFSIRGDEKFLFFRPVKAILRTDEANSMAFLQTEFLPWNDT